jgi:hypothetical protein
VEEYAHKHALTSRKGSSKRVATYDWSPKQI